MQKDFAEQLCVDFQRAGYYPFFDKCGYCLPKGEKFPELLFKAASHCLMAILLLTEDFFTRTKWPMQELATFMRARKSRPDIRILPVLLAISLDDLKNPAKWFPIWTKWAKKDHHIDRYVIREWEAAVLALKPFNSISRQQGEGDVGLRERVLKSVMETMPSDVRSSVLHVQGRERICKELQAKFNAALPSQRIANTKVLGMFGIGGAGKSTACMLITESMRKAFSGRVCHVEFKPDTSTLKLQCTVLRELIRDNEVFLDRHMTNEHKGWNRLEESISSDQALVKQLGIPRSDCFHCPKLTAEEALHLLLDRLNMSVNCLDKAHMQILNQTVERSFFDGYHPLALTLFAGQLGANLDTWRISDIDIQESSEEKHPLFSIIDTSYTSLPNQEIKDLFMDIALFTPEGLRSVEEISLWLYDTLYHDNDVNQEGWEQIKKKVSGYKFIN
ncbi:hypothetical protein GOP47_0015725 [Adiantum capillus-veneris]|uniref:TIR domain-containing protein n=1 Tax=Adiantum capillus-veneris TaxID=13818 RepID=A0A9D4UK84_ADICA|nr:hypothetical protein GOP47_0015725 [Adiantum capillus-veneris]